jgi:hypothetical protein
MISPKTLFTLRVRAYYFTPRRNADRLWLNPFKKTKIYKRNHP